jgi:hypothetical protein
MGLERPVAKHKNVISLMTMVKHGTGDNEGGRPAVGRARTAWPRVAGADRAFNRQNGFYDDLVKRHTWPKILRARTSSR